MSPKSNALPEEIEAAARAIAICHFRRQQHSGYAPKERIEETVEAYWHHFKPDAVAALEAAAAVRENGLDH
jgi:hypothetical protein